MLASLFFRLAPVVFVLLWSSGFVFAKVVDPYAEPLTTLAIRFAAVIAIFLLWALIARVSWPDRRMALQSLGVGALLHGVYLGGVFAAVDRGLPAGPSALIVGLQPVLTGLFLLPFAASRPGPKQWMGIFLGFAGVVLVIWPKLTGPEAWPVNAIIICTAGLFGITLASIWQKRISGRMDLRAAGVFQYSGGFVVVMGLALILEQRTVVWTPEFAFAVFWLVAVLSIGAVSLYMVLIARGSIVSTSSLMYLVPAITAIMAYFMFDERLLPLQILGMIVTAVGVAIVSRPGRVANTGG